jgi:hypothetical protein
MKLLNEKVTHKKYGYGMITCEMDNKVDIQFESTESKKCFVFPDAFEKFLTLENQDLQNECIAIYKLKQELYSKELEEKRLLKEQLEEENKKQTLEQAKRKRKVTVKSKKIS